MRSQFSGRGGRRTESCRRRAIRTVQRERERGGEEEEGEEEEGEEEEGEEEEGEEYTTLS